MTQTQIDRRSQTERNRHRKISFPPYDDQVCEVEVHVCVFEVEPGEDLVREAYLDRRGMRAHVDGALG